MAVQHKLENELQGVCDFSDAAVALYTSDASNYRQIPFGVVYPATIDDIVLSADACRAHQLPVLMRGGGTSQNGQCVNEAIVLDCSRYMDNVLEIDPDTRTALVQPGIVCDSLKAEAEKQQLTFGPDPATHSRCTLGGMIGNNSCGPRSMLAGKTVENVIELEILTSDGHRFWVGPTSEAQLNDIVSADDRRAQIYRSLLQLRDEYADEIRARYPTIKRRVSGYNLDQLLPENNFNVARALVGSEGTCVSILQARVKLIEKPRNTRLVVLGFLDIFDAGDSVMDIMPFAPTAMEGLDWGIVGGLNDRDLKQTEVALLPEGKAWILVELAAKTPTESDAQCTRFVSRMQQIKRVTSTKLIAPEDEAAIWSIREQGASATAMSLDPNGIDPVVGWEDTAVDPAQLGDYLRAFKALVDQYGYTTSLYGHFGDGCIHARITFDTRSNEGVSNWRKFSNDIAHLVVRFGGSLSGEHGDGQAKAEFLPIMYGDKLMTAFQRFKDIWDPARRMNPGKLIDAYRMDDNLRFGPDYATAVIPTQLHFVEDPQGFGRSTERCIGMGKCRAHTGAMCPSYQATREERYSTRGRAHLLHELVRGEVLAEGWQDKAVADSMEHCLSCKACKSECPTQVDIASYKAEFMHRHFQTRRRPFAHHVFGRIGQWLPLLSKIPRIVNAVQGGMAGSIVKRILGISQSKTLPSLAQQTFLQWVQSYEQQQTSMHTQEQSEAYLPTGKQGPGNKHGDNNHFYCLGKSTAPCVVLWSDSINGHYRPDVLKSAVNVLIKIGYQVAIPKMHFCCGRPLYEYGLLNEAKAALSNILENFYPYAPDSARILVLEPSCLSVFKDELLRLYPDNANAIGLSRRCTTLAEFLVHNKITIKKPFKTGILHLHCHDKALQVAEHDRALLKACVEQLTEAEAGCCGMAGSFGIRDKTRTIGQTLFDRALKPAIVQADSQAVIIANGFSCQEQISDGTGRKALHPVEVLESCL